MKKSFLRSEFLNMRRILSTSETEDKNEAILKNCVMFFKTSTARTIHIFLPQTGKKEIDTWPIISFLQNLHQISIVSPRIIPGTREMEHYRLTPETKLIVNKWDISEPDPETSLRVLPDEIDSVFLPLLAFDKKGYRVGYGGGYYDRFLAQCRSDVVKIGLSFFDPIDEISDIDPFDVPMDYCVTPSGIVQF